MSQKIGMNVALGLDTGKWQAGLARAKRDMNGFADTAKKLGPKLGMGGIGKAGGLIGDAAGVFGGGATMAGMGGLLVGFAGTAKIVKATIAAITSMNAAVLDARKAMESFSKTGKFDPSQMGAFTKSAAQAVINPGKANQFGEVLASNLKPRSIEDALVSYAISSAPAAFSAAAGEMVNVIIDAITGRAVGNYGGRLQAAAGATLVGGLGETGADFGAKMLEEERNTARALQQMLTDFRGF